MLGLQLHTRIRFPNADVVKGIMNVLQMKAMHSSFALFLCCTAMFLLRSLVASAPLEHSLYTEAESYFDYMQSARR